MSRSGRVDVAVRLEGSGGADPGVVELVVDVWSPGDPGGEVLDAQLGRNFLFLAKISIFFLRGKRGRKGQEGDGTHLGIFPDSCADMMDYFYFTFFSAQKIWWRTTRFYIGNWHKCNHLLDDVINQSSHLLPAALRSSHL